MEYQITLEIEANSEAMAYQLLAIAIKKKFKKEIRPYFVSPTNELDIMTAFEKEVIWNEKAGQSYDY